MTKETFAKEIKRLRVARGWGQKDAAKFCGVSTHTWLKWEKATVEAHAVAMEGVLARLDAKYAILILIRGVKGIDWKALKPPEREGWRLLLAPVGEILQCITPATK